MMMKYSDGDLMTEYLAHLMVKYSDLMTDYMYLANLTVEYSDLMEYSDGDLMTQYLANLMVEYYDLMTDYLANLMVKYSDLATEYSDYSTDLSSLLASSTDETSAQTLEQVPLDIQGFEPLRSNSVHPYSFLKEKK